MSAPLGIIEGFFGPTWSWEERALLAPFLGKFSSSHASLFYLYAPKRDPYLRKLWMQSYPPSEFAQLLQLRRTFQEYGVGFGIGLSPFGLNDGWNKKIESSLKRKLHELKTLKCDFLGLFFDDMKSHPDLLKNQLQALDVVAQEFSGRILFCPTYYSDDPILEKVFGPCPKGYLDGLAKQVDLSIDLMWTGPKVISPEISAEHLQAVGERLGRPPFIWDNIFANDGPRQCKFLKLKALEGRTEKSFAASAGWCLNPMNQAALSRMVVASAFKVLTVGASDAHAVFSSVIEEKGGAEFLSWWNEFQNPFINLGLDKIDATILASQLPHLSNPYIREIENFLHGHYAVGPECLTD